ncbi:hypothetical protein LTR17_018610 [Elasticomyces elasticus]|nr:hypothetical protein LTR17_018610 [Elasticomyces elasticus]
MFAAPAIGVAEWYYGVKCVANLLDVCKRDVEKGGDALMWYTSGAHVPGLRVSAERDPEDDIAWFSAAATQGREAVQWTQGVWTGFPVVNNNGVMRGNFSVHMPGYKEPTAGEWIAVERPADMPDMNMTRVSEALVAAMPEGKEGRSQMNLDQLLERVTANMH